MSRVASYVFLDLETTGLPKFELNKTRITELSMVVVSRRHILATRPGCSPRVQDKLSMCFNPRKFIHPDCSAVTGLDNDLLEHKTPFNMNVFNIINSFLQCFEKPVCLVAQNGHSFDFPILKNHIEKLGVSLPDDILCADSLNAFYDIFRLRSGLDNKNEAGSSVVDHQTDGVKADELSGNEKQGAQISEEKVEEIKSNKEISKDPSTHSEEHLTEEVLRDFEVNDDLNCQKKIQQKNERTPVQKQQVSYPKPKHKVRRQLFYMKPGTKSCKAPAVSFKLKDVYERFVGRPAIEAHRAENDCIMAMEASVAIAKEFVDWVDNADNQCKFSEVNAMRLGVPLGLLVLTGVLWGCTNPFIRQGTKGLRDVTATTLPGQVWAEVTFLLGNWKYVLPWLVNQAGSLSYLAAVQRAPLSVAVPVANSLAFVFTAVTGASIGAEEPLDARSIVGIVLIMAGTALCCLDDTS